MRKNLRIEKLLYFLAIMIVFSNLNLPGFCSESSSERVKETLLDKVEASNKKLSSELSESSYTNYLKKQIESSIKEYKQKVLELAKHTFDGKAARIKEVSKRISYLKFWMGNLRNQLRIKNAELQSIYEQANKDTAKLDDMVTPPSPDDKVNWATIDAIEKRKKLKGQLDGLQALKRRLDKFTVKPAKRTKTEKKEKVDAKSDFGRTGMNELEMESLKELIEKTIKIDAPQKENAEEFKKFMAENKEIGKSISKLIETLTGMQDVQVTIEVRFIKLTDEFFEKIGVDFDFILEEDIKKKKKAEKTNKKVSHRRGSFPSRIQSLDDELSYIEPVYNKRHGELAKLYQNKKVKFKLAGDGGTTSSVVCSFDNQSGCDLSIHLTPGMLFYPDKRKYQTMMVSNEKLVLVPANKSAVCRVGTFCVSTRDVKPPPKPERGTIYRPGYPEDIFENKSLISILATSLELSGSGAFKKLLIPQASRSHTIAQLAVWKKLGEKTKTTKDDVTVVSIRDDLMKKSGKKYEELSVSQQKGIDSGVAAIFSAVDLTQKTSENESSEAKDLGTI